MKRMVVAVVLASGIWLLAENTPSDKPVLIQGVTISGAPHLRFAKREAILGSLRNRRCTPEEIGEAAERLRYDMQEQGYFQAAVNDPEVKVRSIAGNGKVVDVIFRVEEGTLYHLERIELTGVKAFPPGEIRALFHIQDGDVFAASEVNRGFDRLRQLYGTKGYVTVTPVPDTRIDSAKGRVLLTIDVDEGLSYAAGRLIIDGEEAVPGAAEKLSKAWERYRGQPFNYDLLYRLLRDVNASPKITPDDVFKWSMDEKAGVVNVKISLTKPFD